MTNSLRPGILNSKTVRSVQSNNPVRGSIADFIDSLAQQYDAISTLHSTIDPEMTKTGHALKVKSAVVRAMDANSKRAVKIVEQLEDYEKRLHQQAYQNAGLLQGMPESHLSELRSALRSMTTKEREKAISDAFKAGDVAVIRAVNEASSPVLVGAHSLPLNQMLDSYIKSKNPDLEQNLEEIDELNARLDVVSDAFGKSVNGLRDVSLEQQAELNKQLTSEALSKLDPLLR